MSANIGAGVSLANLKQVINTHYPDIISFQEHHVNPIMEDLDEILKAEYKEASARKGTKKAGVDNKKSKRHDVCADDPQQANWNPLEI